MLTVSGQGSSQVCVQVPPVLLQQILEAPPDQLHRSSGELCSLFQSHLTTNTPVNIKTRSVTVQTGPRVPAGTIYLF